MSKGLTQKRHQSDAIILPSEHQGRPAERAPRRPEMALDGHPKCTSLGARDTDAGPMLVEERATLLTQLFVRRVLLTNGGEESHSALVRQEVQEPHEFPMQAAGGGRDQRQESIVFVLVVETVLRYRTLGSVDAHAVGVLSMPRRAMATDRRRRGISWTESSKNKKAPVIMNRILQDSGNARILRHLQCPNPPRLLQCPNPPEDSGIAKGYI